MFEWDTWSLSIWNNLAFSRHFAADAKQMELKNTKALVLKEETMKRGMVTLIVISLLLLTISPISAAELDLQRDQPIPAKVLEVIESNVYKLLVYDTAVPHVEVYALIGVKPGGDQRAYDYSVKKLLNQMVYLLEDGNITPRNGIRFCYLYVDLNISHNEDLLKQGFAIADSNFSSAREYLKYTRSQDQAKNQSLGIFNYSDKKLSDRILNINAAGIDQISLHFGIDNFKASAWHSRITENPINRLAELRALDADFFTAEVILEYAPSIHLRTNLQTALPYEITSLTGRIANNSQLTDQIIRYRLFKDSITEKDYKGLNILETQRRAMQPYLTFDENYHEFFGGNAKVININAANEAQIIDALGVSLAQAVLLRDYAKTHSYPLRNVEELFKPHFPLNKEIASITALSDNIRTLTPINTAGESEIRSLFGKVSMGGYKLADTIKDILNKRPFKDQAALEAVIGKSTANAIAKYIYFDTLPETTLINLNTAGKDKLVQEFKLTDSQKSQLRSQYINPSELPAFLMAHIQKITLYTNINRAGFDELYQLTPDMTKALVEDILRARSGEGFYVLADVRKIFEKHERQDTFDKIQKYLILQ